MARVFVSYYQQVCFTGSNFTQQRALALVTVTVGTKTDNQLAGGDLTYCLQG